MSGAEMHEILSRYEDAAARGSVEAQLAFATLAHAIKEAVRTGAIPPGEEAAKDTGGQSSISEVAEQRPLAVRAALVIFQGVRDGLIRNGEGVTVGSLSRDFGLSEMPVRLGLERLRAAGIVAAQKGAKLIFSSRNIPRKRG